MGEFNFTNIEGEGPDEGSPLWAALKALAEYGVPRETLHMLFNGNGVPGVETGALAWALTEAERARGGSGDCCLGGTP